REAARTNPSAGSALFNPFMESRAQARDVLRAPLPGDMTWSVLGPLWILGEHREMRDLLRTRIDDLLARGIIPAAVFDLAVLVRIHNVLGEYDEAQARLDEGFALLPRISETSNAAFQLLGSFALLRTVRGELFASTELGG